MLVVIDEPVGLYYGGQIAAPVVGSIMKDMLQYFKFTPDYSASKNDEVHTFVPNLINLTVPQAIKVLEQGGLKARVEEDGFQVTDQIPKPQSRILAGSSVLLYTKSPRYGEGDVTVPDLTGRTVAESIQLLSQLGLSIDLAGQEGKVIKQDPLPGAKVSAGSSITVYLEPF